MAVAAITGTVERCGHGRARWGATVRFRNPPMDHPQ
jgi:hypothetical protein